MIELPTAIPDVEVLLALEPEELAGKMLFLLRARAQRMCHVGKLRSELWSQALSGWPQYRKNRHEEVDLAIAEALAWCEAQALIVPAEDPNGQNGFRHLSRRARRGLFFHVVCQRRCDVDHRRAVAARRELDRAADAEAVGTDRQAAPGGDPASLSCTTGGTMRSVSTR